MAGNGAPATPAAFYKMLSVPDAVELILSETALLPAEEVPFAAAFQHTLAADVLAAEPVPGFRASIKASPLVASISMPFKGAPEQRPARHGGGRDASAPARSSLPPTSSPRPQRRQLALRSLVSKRLCPDPSVVPRRHSVLNVSSSYRQAHQRCVLMPRHACLPAPQDGYAVLSTDGPGEYDVAFEAFAGVAPRTLAPGTVAYIGTGGPLPEGADAGLCSSRPSRVWGPGRGALRLWGRM